MSLIPTESPNVANALFRECFASSGGICLVGGSPIMGGAASEQECANACTDVALGFNAFTYDDEDGDCVCYTVCDDSSNVVPFPEAPLFTLAPDLEFCNLVYGECPPNDGLCLNGQPVTLEGFLEGERECATQCGALGEAANAFTHDRHH
ncbi:MAG: hypothetical protein SGARI_003275 [Bacillariaceae sp.]